MMQPVVCTTTPTRMAPSKAFGSFMAGVALGKKNGCQVREPRRAHSLLGGLTHGWSLLLVDGFRMAYVFYESGLSVNVMYGIKEGEKRAVGFKLSEGMGVPEELASRFKFARQKSKLAGVIRGSFFVIKGEY